MLRKARFGALFALVALVAAAAFAPIAAATPGESSPCSDCHGGAGATITTTLVSMIGSTATYDFSAPGADAVADVQRVEQAHGDQRVERYLHGA